MARKRERDYKAEYRRRLAKAEEQGYSRAQARGHPGPKELTIREEKRLTRAPRKGIEQRRAGDLITPKTKERLRKANLARRKRGEKPTVDIPASVLDRLDHATRQYIFGY